MKTNDSLLPNTVAGHIRGMVTGEAVTPPSDNGLGDAKNAALHGMDAISKAIQITDANGPDDTGFGF